MQRMGEKLAFAAYQEFTMPTLTGTAGNDVIAGGGLDDILDGLAGDDILAGGGGADLISGGSGRNALDGGDGLDTVSYLDATRGVTVSLALTAYQDTGYSLDELRNFERLIGSRSHADILTGSNGDDVIDTGSRLTRISTANPDIIVNMSDQVFGGSGDDIITAQGNSNDDFLSGEDGNDTITVGFSAAYVVSGSFSAPNVLSQFFQPFLGAPVRIDGGAGDDILSAAGHALIDGGAGDDIIRASLSVETFRDPAAAFVTFGVGYRGADSTIRLTGGSGRDTFIVSNAGGVAVITDFETGIDRLNISGILAQQGADTLVVNASDPTVIIARLLNVTASAIPAASLLAGNAVPVLTYLTDAADSAQGNYFVGLGGDDVLTAIGSSGARLYGGDGNDTLNGSASADIIDGGLGDDILYGGLGADVLRGGPYYDVFQYRSAAESNAAGYDIIQSYGGGQQFIGGNEYIDLTALGVIQISLVYVTTTSAFLFATTATGDLQIGITGQIGATSIHTGGAVGFTILGESPPQGRTEGNPWIRGSDYADRIVGGAGNDIIVGGRGADALSGGAGADLFQYETASDSNAGGFDNLADFQTGIDTVGLGYLSPTSASVVRTDDGSSFVFAETASGAFMTSSAGRAINGVDIVGTTTPLSFGIYMIGSSLGETLIGSVRADPIYGNGGNDTIIGGGGADVLFGGAGADTFVVRTATESSVAAADTIFDFVAGQDRLDLSGLRTGASDTVGIAYFNGGSFVFVDLGGNGTNDALIQLANVRLTMADTMWAPTASELESNVKVAGPEVLPATTFSDVDLDGLPTQSGMFMTMAPDSLRPSFHGQDWYL